MCMESITSLFVHGGQSSSINVSAILIWITVLSLLTFVLSLLFLPYLIRKLPSDYFLKLSNEQPKAFGYDIKIIFLYLVRNIFGIFLLLSGIAMLFLPGQGLVTIFISLLLLDFPLKKRIISYLIHIKKVKQTIDWIRKKSDKEPIDWPSDR